MDIVNRLTKTFDLQIIYSLLNAHDGSTEATNQILNSKKRLPLVRHYKEHPCIPTLEERMALLNSDAQIYINQRSFDYFATTYNVPERSAYIMDADLLSESFMTGLSTHKLRESDGRPHLLVAGGLSISEDRLDMRDFCAEMSKRDVHVHLYGRMLGRTRGGSLIEGDAKTSRVYGEMAESNSYIHLHKYIPPSQFSSMWSQYDAGVMHARVNSNHEEAEFETMNLPYRYSAYLAAGLPLIVPSFGQEAMSELATEHGIGIVFDSYDDLRERVEDRANMKQVTERAKKKRTEFSFEKVAPMLVDVLRRYAKK